MAEAVENGKEKGKRGEKIKLRSEALKEKKRLQKEKEETENNNERKNKDMKNVKKKIRIRSKVRRMRRKIMRRIIERNLLRTFRKIHSISDTYISGLIFRKVSAIYCATQANDTDQRAREILRRWAVNHGLCTTWKFGRDVGTVQLKETRAYSCVPALQRTCL